MCQLTFYSVLFPIYLPVFVDIFRFVPFAVTFHSLQSLWTDLCQKKKWNQCVGASLHFKKKMKCRQGMNGLTFSQKSTSTPTGVFCAWLSSALSCKVLSLAQNSSFFSVVTYQQLPNCAVVTFWLVLNYLCAE